jgi:hypothetical protein
MAMGKDRSVFSLNIFSYHVNEETVCTYHGKYINNREKGKIHSTGQRELGSNTLYDGCTGCGDGDDAFNRALSRLFEDCERGAFVGDASPSPKRGLFHLRTGCNLSDTVRGCPISASYWSRCEIMKAVNSTP